MISRLRGETGGMDDDGAVVVMCNGVGYRVVVHDRDRTIINARGEGGDVEIFARSIAKEPPEGVIVYGFLDVSDRRAFDHLLTVEGVGPSTALRLLSKIEHDDLKAAIINGDSKALQKIHGVGAKMSAKIISAGWIP